MAKRGRPIKPDAKRSGIRFRLRKDQADKLQFLSEKTGKSRTDIFVEMLDDAYEKVAKED